MLIEHTSGSIEDKPETEECVGALQRSTGCFNQQSLLGRPTQNVSQQSSNQSPSQLKVNPRKSQHSPEKSTQGSNNKVNATPTSVNLLTLIFCANEYGLQKQNSPQNFSSNGPFVDQSQCWSNLPRNPNCKKIAAINFVLQLHQISSFFSRGR